MKITMLEVYTIIKCVKVIILWCQISHFYTNEKSELSGMISRAATCPEKPIFVFNPAIYYLKFLILLEWNTRESIILKLQYTSFFQYLYSYTHNINASFNSNIQYMYTSFHSELLWQIARLCKNQMFLSI